jgi:tetratricopeptide (TPR) repeat protein/TolB-like protein
MPLQSGVRLGAYEIVALVGAGGMGEVYRARDTRLDRIVAVKILPPGNPDLKVRFEREARVVSSLDHPNVCALYDVGHEDGIDYLVMQFLEGETLASRIERGPLPLSDSMRVAGEVASALQAAHRRGIVHRDLKPANIFLSSNTGGDVVKLLDFGLAIRRTPEGGSQAITTVADETSKTTVSQPGAAIGTLPYMAPEQVEGQPVDARADVFAFGAVLYEMVTGQRAFRGATRLGVAGSILHDDPPAMSSLRQGVPADLERLVKKCLAKRPTGRFSSGAELVPELERIEALIGRRDAWRPSRVVGVVLAATTVAALAVAIAYLRFEHASVPAGAATVAADTTVLAVLPFEADSADASRKAYWSGLSDAVTTKLAALPASYHLTVLSQGEIRRNGVRDARLARTELGATQLISGKATSAPASITLELMDTTANRVLGVRTVSPESTSDSQSPEARILEAAVSLLGLRLVARDRAVLLAGEGGPGTYDFYLQALGYLQDYDRPENIDTAIGMFRHVLEIDPNSALAYSGLGRAYWNKYVASKDASLLETARQACERALGLDEKEAAPHACLGDVESGVGQYERSLEEFQHALEREPDSDYALLGLATAFERLGRAKEAEDTYQRAIAARPRYWAGYTRLGSFYHNSGRDADAERMFRQVIAILPDSWRGYSNLGAVLYVEGKSDDAIAAFEKSWSLRPNYQAASNLGTLYYFQKGDFQRAAAAFKRALSQDDRQFVVWGNYGSALHWSGDEAGAKAAFSRAITLAEEARKTNPRNARTLMSLAGYYGSLHEIDRARDLMEQALSLDSENAAVLYQAGDLCESELHDRDRAFTLLEKALSRGYQWNELERSPSLAALRRDPRFAELRSLRANTNRRGA